MESVIIRIFRRTMFVSSLIVFLGTTAAAGDIRHELESPRHPTGKVRLQIRISEAKRKKESLRYYRSVARQQKTGKILSPASRDWRTD